jgi:hypothetical protein
MPAVTAPTLTSATPPTVNRPTNARAASGTDRKAPTPALASSAVRVRGSTATNVRNTPQPTTTATSPISVTLVPRAVSPPSANATPWTSRTTVMHSTAVQGPTSTAVSAPPMR